MNDSFNMTRVLSLAACGVLCVGMLTGCFGKKDPAPSTETTSSGGPNLVTTEPTAAPTVATTEATEAPTAAPTKKANVATVKEKVGVRASPSTDSNILSQLNAGDEVEINRVDTNGGIQWAYIPLKGWVDTQYLDMSNVTVGGATSTPAGSTTTTPAATTPTSATTPTTSTNTNTNTSATTGNAVITATTLNIRETPDDDGKILGGYVKGEKVTILETKNGWGRTNRGWISMTYVSQNGTTNNNTNNNTNNSTNNNTTNAKIIDRGIVTGNNLNIRSGAGTANKSVGSYSYLTRVEFTEKKDVDGTTWGKTKDGWISLDYVYIDGTSNGPDYGTGTVTGSNVYVRSGPGTRYDAVGSVTKGDELDILASFEFGGTKWGCISKGWVCMDYVDMD